MISWDEESAVFIYKPLNLQLIKTTPNWTFEERIKIQLLLTLLNFSDFYLIREFPLKNKVLTFADIFLIFQAGLHQYIE